MKLISCHIENFGKLTDYTYTFASGLNVIREDNGYGKSTLATFLRVMFFGFDNAGKRDELSNERKHYMPWQGGAYGGEVAFDDGEKRYRLIRKFGHKEAEDYFELRDYDTMLVSSRYTENIGIELFGLDAASFEKSVYISQNDVETSSTDRINAKMGNLTAASDDIGSFDKIDEMFKKYLDSNTDSRKTGQRAKIKNDIDALEVDISNKAFIEKALQELYDSVNAEEQELRDCRDAAKADEDNLLNEKENKILFDKKNNYREIRDRYDEVLLKEQEIVKLCGKSVPDEQELAALEDKAKSIYQLESRIEENSFSDLQKEQYDKLRDVFADGTPDETYIEDLKRKDSALRLKLEEKNKNRMTENELYDFEKLESKFRGSDNPPQDIKSASDLMKMRQKDVENLGDLKTELDDLKRELTDVNATPENFSDSKAGLGKVKSGRIFLIVGIIFAVFTVGAVIYGSLQYAFNEIPYLRSVLIVFVLGILFVIVGIVNLSSGNKINKETLATIERERKEREDRIAAQNEKITEKEREVKAKESICSTGLDNVLLILKKFNIECDENGVGYNLAILSDDYERFVHLKNTYEKSEQSGLSAEIEALQSEIEQALEKYNIHSTVSENLGKIHELSDKISEYNRLKKMHDECDNLNRQIRDVKSELNSFFEKQEIEPWEDIAAQLGMLREKRYEYSNIVNDKQNLSETEREIRESADFAKIRNSHEPLSDEEIQALEAKKSEWTEKEDTIRDIIAGYQKNIREKIEKLDEIEEKESEVNELREKLMQLNESTRIAELTRKYLNDARNKFVDKYREPVSRAFGKYYSMIDGGEASAYEFTAETELLVNEKGQLRKTELLSRGKRDLAGIAFRMALVEAMFEEERPFLIMDDPFVNLDDAKINGAISLLEKVAGEYQLIYFTCSDSRTPNT